MIKCIIKLFFVLFIFTSCLETNKKNDKKQQGIESETTKVNNNLLADSFNIVGDSVVLPKFEIKLDLSQNAQNLFSQKKESIIVVAYFSGQPKDTTLEEYQKWGEIKFWEHQIELFEGNTIATFEKVTIPKAALDDLIETDFDVLINVYTGRKTSQFNLLDCDILEETINTLKGKSYVLKGKLLEGD